MTDQQGPAPVITLERVSIRRGSETVVDDVSLAVPRGAAHVIVGPNGAGKSTLLSAVLGLTPFSGRILLNWAQSARIGYVPQSFAVDPTLPVTVADFLGLTRQRRPVCLGLGSSTRARVREMLAGVGLPEIGRRPLAVLSGGELRRVLLAHAMDPEPELLILDEPTTGLDEASSRWLETTLRAITASGRTTVLMVSHDFEQVRRIADRVVVLDRRVVAEGTPSEILATSSLKELLASPERMVRR